MADYKLTIQRVSSQLTQSDNAVNSDTDTTAALVLSRIRRNPDVVHLLLRALTDTQKAGIMQYGVVINQEATTTSVESAIAALF